MTSEDLLIIRKSQHFPKESTPLLVKPFLLFDRIWNQAKMLVRGLFKINDPEPQSNPTIYNCPDLLKKAAFPERFATLEQVLVKPEFRAYAYQTTIGHTDDYQEVYNQPWASLTKLESYQMN